VLGSLFHNFLATEEFMPYLLLINKEEEEEEEEEED